MLPPWRVRSTGQTVIATVDAAAYGIAREPLMKGLAMAEVVAGGCREARLRAVGNTGTVELHFLWGDPLARTALPGDLPPAAAGTAPYGLSDAAEPVALPILNGAGECVFTPATDRRAVRVREVVRAVGDPSRLPGPGHPGPAAGGRPGGGR